MLKVKKFLKNFKFCRLVSYQFNKKSYKNLQDLKLKKNSLFLDFEANIGKISQYLYDKYQCRIICYEPNKYAFKELNKIFKNNLNIKCVNKAVSSKESKFKKLYLHKLNKKNPILYSTGSSLDKNKENIDIKNFQNISTISINEILKSYNVIDLIKIDIEGNEYEILPEIFKNKKKIKKVICELHGSSKKTKNSFLHLKYKKTIKYLKKMKLYGNWFTIHH